jgi:23S rRNA pseudouridine1911/1915/1917 synthase
MSPPETHEFRVPAEATGRRLDAWLAEQMPPHSRSEIRRCIDAGLVSVNGEREKASHPLRAGEIIRVQIPSAAPALPEAEEIALDVVFEDEHLIVINKPPGLVVHPGRGNLTGTLVNALLHHCPDITGVGGVRRPGIVHRLDRGTSGLLVAAKDDRAHTALSAALKRREVHRRYDALAWGGDIPERGVIEAPIGRDPRNRLRMAVRPGGRSAVTHFEVTRRSALVCRLSLRLETGRTHQIRVHLRHLRHPVVGDELYGGLSNSWISRLQREDSAAAAAVRRLARPMLHAGGLAFAHPITGESLDFQASPPADFRRMARRLGL